MVGYRGTGKSTVGRILADRARSDLSRHGYRARSTRRRDPLPRFLLKRENPFSATGKSEPLPNS